MSDVSKLNVDSFKALIIPSFSDHYDKKIVDLIYNMPVVRSAIKEFNVKNKYIVPIGPTAINLVAKCLGSQLRPFPLQS